MTGLGGLALYPFTPTLGKPVRPGLGDTLDDLISVPVDKSVELQYNLYVDLRDDSEGGVVIVPLDNPLDPYAANLLAFTDLLPTDYEASVPSDVAGNIANEAEDRGVFRRGQHEWNYIVIDGAGTMRLLTSGPLLILIPNEQWPSVLERRR